MSNANTPKGWKVIHKGHGRGDTSTRVEFADGRGINFSGRLTKTRAVELATETLRQWTVLNMVESGLSAFNSQEVA